MGDGVAGRLGAVGDGLQTSVFFFLISCPKYVLYYMTTIPIPIPAIACS